MIDETMIGGSIVNPGTLLWGVVPEERTNRRKKDEEKLVAVYVVSEGYVTRRTWILPREIFLFEFSLDSLSLLCSSQYPLIDIPRHEMRYRGNDMYVSERRNRCAVLPLRAAIPTNGSRTDLFP